MDRIGDIALFLRVLDLGSISAAARSLDLSVAVASQRLQRLERDLGVRLLHRTTRQLHPTPEGLVLAEQGRVLVEDLEALTGGLRQAGTGVAGTLRVTMSSTFGRLYVSPLLPAFLARHPGVRVSVDLNDQKVDLVSAGLRPGDPHRRAGRLQPGGAPAGAPTGACCAHRRTTCGVTAPRRRPAELAQHHCLLLVGAQGRQDSWRLGDGARRRGDGARAAGRSRATRANCCAMRRWPGSASRCTRPGTSREDLREGRLQVVLPDYPLADTGIHAVMPQRRLVPPRVRAFVDFLAEWFGDTPPWERGTERSGPARSRRCAIAGHGPDALDQRLMSKVFRRQASPQKGRDGSRPSLVVSQRRRREGSCRCAQRFQRSRRASTPLLFMDVGDDDHRRSVRPCRDRAG